jgi:FkbM family methyltransferase
MSIIEGFRGYYSAGGVRGLMAISLHRLTGWPKELTIYPTGFAAPISIRIRTTDLTIYDTILRHDEYDFHLSFTPRVIVDIGANIGMASIWFARQYPEASIFAVEAEESNYVMLLKNVEPYKNVRPIHAAVWNRDGEIRIADPDATINKPGKCSFVTRDIGSGGIPVRALTMNSLMSECGIETIDIVKMDIEGAEKEIFEGSCEWVNRLQCLMVELHDRFRPGCSAAVNGMLRGFTALPKGETTLYLRS